MSINSACIVIQSPKSGKMSLFKSVGGHPPAVIPWISRAISGYRKHIRNRPGRLICLIAGASGSMARAASLELFADDAALKMRHEWRYELSDEPYKPAKIRVTHIDVDGFEEIKYDGFLDHYLSKIVSRLPKPRGRTPAGYRTRAEYELDYATRLRGAAPPSFKSPTAHIEEERAENDFNPSHVDLRNVRVFTPAELRARNKAARTPRKKA